jgi:hypothetical protein
VPPGDLDRVERMLLIHLLQHHGQQIRFEASPWVTEFGIVRQFSSEPPEAVRRSLHTLELGRLVYRRTQYVVGYSEPKHVYSLTPSGHRKAVEVREAGATALDAAPGDGAPATARAFGSGDPPERTEPTA